MVLSQTSSLHCEEKIVSFFCSVMLFLNIFGIHYSLAYSLFLIRICNGLLSKDQFFLDHIYPSFLLPPLSCLKNVSLRA